MKQLLLVAVVSVTIGAGQATAQDTRSAPAACTDSAVTTGLYRRCALWIEGGKVRRGEEGAMVARPRFLRPMALRRVVVGDSAQAHALDFENRTRDSMVLQLFGSALIVASYVVLTNRECRVFLPSSCDYTDADWMAGSLAVGGVGLSISGLIVQVRAQRSAGRAIWWNNERFAR